MASLRRAHHCWPPWQRRRAAAWPGLALALTLALAGLAAPALARPAPLSLQQQLRQALDRLWAHPAAGGQQALRRQLRQAQPPGQVEAVASSPGQPEQQEQPPQAQPGAEPQGQAGAQASQGGGGGDKARLVYGDPPPKWAWMAEADPKYDHSSMVGKAKGRKAGGRPDPMPGLAQPDIPHTSDKVASMEDLVLPYGYPLETYPVETDDGFVLRMYRIPYGLKNSTKPTAAGKPVVLLFHGITMSSASFVVMDPESSMAFYLADAGFDVWMANSRGNTYSRGNRRYRSTDDGYWDDSMDELALLDRPAQIDFVLNMTGAPTIGTIGHSQGCTLTLMLLASQVKYQDKLWMLMLQAPVTHTEYLETPFLKKAAADNSIVFMADAGIGGLMPTYLTTNFLTGCKPYSSRQLCFDFVNAMFYGGSKYGCPCDFMRVGATWPGGVSTRNLAHWSQMYHTRNGVAMFNFGTNCTSSLPRVPFKQDSCNQARYGSEDPPQYEFAKIVNVTAALLTGSWDLMGTQPDLDILKKRWHANVVFDKVYPEVSHMDFVWARDPVMKPDVLRIMWDYAPDIYKRKQ